jgi:hypothetical protein
MGALRPYDRDQVKAELRTIVDSANYLCGRVDNFQPHLPTEARIINEATLELFKVRPPVKLIIRVDGSIDEVPLTDVPPPFPTPESFFGEEFRMGWNALEASRRRLALLLDDGDIDLLDCDADERFCLQVIWEYVQRLPNQLPQPLFPHRIRTSEFYLTLAGTGSPVDVIDLFASVLDGSPIGPNDTQGLDFPPGARERTRMVAAMIKSGADANAVAERFGITPNNVSKIKSRYVT